MRSTPAFRPALSARSVPSIAGRISSILSAGIWMTKGEAVWATKRQSSRRGVPAVVLQQIEGDELEPANVGAGLGQGVANLVGLGEVAHAAAHLVARRQQCIRDVAAEESGDAGEEDAVWHGSTFPDRMNELYDYWSIRSIGILT